MASKSRRSFVARIGMGGLAALVAPDALAQTSSSERRGAPASSERERRGAPSGAPAWSQEYSVQKGGVKLYMFRKRRSAPKAGERPLPVLFLVHGSSLSGRPTFDLVVPGRGEYSLMETFAGYGFDVWTMDFEGYGRSSRTEGNSDIAEGVRDLKAAIDLVTKETGQRRVHFFGESSGGLRAGAFAMAYPDRVDRLVLAAFTYTGEGSPTLPG